MKLWKNRRTGTVWASESTRDGFVRPPWDTGLKRYPLVWMNWDYVQNCYHGQAAVTGLIPNQVFVNKMFAMTMISLMTTAYPKVVYDQTRVSKWDSRVGAAIGVNGGDVNNVAKTIDPAAISPQVSQFIQLAINLTKEFMGATDAALGDVRPDNTSAILALQKASAVPMELTKQNLFQCVEDLGNIWLDLMRVSYGVRYAQPENAENGEEDRPEPALFDFSLLGEIPLSMKLDVGGSAYGNPAELGDTVQELTMTQDKAFTYTIDKGNEQEQLNVKAASKSLRWEIDEVVIPAMDKYRFDVWCKKAGTVKGLSAAPDKNTVTGLIMDSTEVLDDALVPEGGRTLFITASMYKALKENPDFLGVDKLGERALAKGQVGEIDGMKVVKVPTSYLPEGVYWLITHKSAVLGPAKLQDYKIHKDPPGINGDLVEGRVLHDAFVLEAKKDAVYVASSTKASSPRR